MARNNIVSMPMRPLGVGNRPITRDLTTPYVSVNGYNYSQQRILIGTQDDVEVEVDLRTYDIMENDATVTKSKKILVSGALADEMQLAPGATENEVGSQEFKTYVAIMEFCQRLHDGLDRPYRESCEQILGNAIKYGHGIAETEWEYRMDGRATTPNSKPTDTKTTSMWHRFGIWLRGTDSLSMDASSDEITRPTLRSQKTRLMPKSIKVKPRGATRFVVDNFMTVIGLMPRWRNGTNLTWNEIIDRDKFLILTINKQDEDPRGRSMYRPAFNWHNLKVQMPAEILRLILEETVPKAVAVLAAEAQPFEFERDADDNILYEDDAKTIPKMVTAAESLKRIIENFRSGSGAVVPFGTSLAPFKNAGTGDPSQLAVSIIKLIDGQIQDAILNQTLAQSEGEHQARSASQQVAEILYNLIFGLKWQIAMMTLTDLFEVAVKVNFGDWAVRYLPQVSFGDFVRRDWNADLAGLADAYFKGFLDDTQRAELMAWMNLPRPGPSRQEQNIEAAAKADVNGQPIQPNNNRPDKSGAGSGRNNGNGTEKKNDNKQTGDTTSRFSVGNALGHHKRGSGFVSRYLFSGRK